MTDKDDKTDKADLDLASGLHTYLCCDCGAKWWMESHWETLKCPVCGSRRIDYMSPIYTWTPTDKDPGSWIMVSGDLWDKADKDGRVQATVVMAPHGGWTAEIRMDDGSRVNVTPVGSGIRWSTAQDAMDAADEALRQTRTG